MQIRDTIPPQNSIERFSDVLHSVRTRAEAGSLTFQELLELFGPKGHVFLTIFLVLPFMQPIPLPGISTALGLVIALVGFFLMLDRPPWLPDRLANLRVEGPTMLRICSGLESLMRRLEPWIKPRSFKLFGRDILREKWFRRMNGAILCFHATILSLPLPIPFSNFFPAVVLLLVALGTLEEDIYVVLVGYVASMVNLAFFSALVIIPYLSVHAFKS